MTAGLDFVFISTDAPTFTTGHGYYRTIVYGAKYTSGALPTFASATRVHEFVGQVGSFASELGTEWHIWLKWLSKDGVESVSPYGGTNGATVTTGKIGSADLGPLVVLAGNLANGSVTASKIASLAVDATKFASGIEPVTLVTSVPGSLNTRSIFNTTDGKLYRWNGSAYVATVPSTDISGTLADAQLAAIAAAKITGQITGTQITDGSISTIKLAANSVTTDKLIVTGRGKALNDDPSCSDASAWTTTFGALAVQVDTTAPVGKSSLRGSGAARFQSRSFPVEAGKTYKVAAWVKQVSGTGVLYLRLVANDSAGSLVSYQVTAITPSVGTFEAATVPSSWTRHVGYATPGAGAVLAVAEVNLNWTGTGTADITDIRVEEYIGADLIVDGSISASKIAADTITANEIAAGAITSSELHADSVVAGKIATGAVNAAQIVAGAVSTDKLLVTGRGTALNADPACSDPSAWGLGGTTRRSFVTISDGVAGTKALRLEATGDFGYEESQLFPAAAGKQYRLRLKARRVSGTGTSYLRIRYYDSAFATLAVAVNAITPTGISTFEGVTVPSGPGWTEYSGTSVAPAGTVQANIQLYGNYPAGSGWTEVQDVRVEEYIGYDLIVDGAIIASKLAANAIAVGTAAIQNGAIVNAMLGNATITDAKIASLSASKLLAGSIGVGEYIQSSSFSPGGTGFRIDGGGGVEIRNSGGTRVFNLGASGTQPILKVGSALELLANGNATFGGDISTSTGNFSADRITTGTLRGVNVNAASHTTKGSYLTAAVSAGAPSITLANAADFPDPSLGGGSGVAFFWVIDSGGSDLVGYGGKSGNTLNTLNTTGPNAIDAHAAGCSVAPYGKAMVIDAGANEMRFFGDRGDGTIEEIASIGITQVGSDYAVVKGGTLNNTSTTNAYIGVHGQSAGPGGFNAAGVLGEGKGGVPGVVGYNASTGPGARFLSNSGSAVHLWGNTTSGQMYMVPLNGRPSNRTEGQVAMIYTTSGVTDFRVANARLMTTDGTNWRYVSDQSIFSG